MTEYRIEELDRKIDDLTKNVAVINSTLSTQEKSIAKLSEGIEKLMMYIEKTNENDKKIEKLFKLYESIRKNGVELCPVQLERIKRLEASLKKAEGIIISLIIAIILQFIGELLHYAAHIKF